MAERAPASGHSFGIHLCALVLGLGASVFFTLNVPPGSGADNPQGWGPALCPRRRRSLWSPPESTGSLCSSSLNRWASRFTSWNRGNYRVAVAPQDRRSGRSVDSTLTFLWSLTCVISASGFGAGLACLLAATADAGTLRRHSCPAHAEGHGANESETDASCQRHHWGDRNVDHQCHPGRRTRPRQTCSTARSAMSSKRGREPLLCKEPGGPNISSRFAKLTTCTNSTIGRSANATSRSRQS